MTQPASAEDPDSLRAALTYAARGWPVAPCWSVRHDKPRDATGRHPCSCGDVKCESRGKHPIGRLVPNGLKQASTNPETIRAWWADSPDANILIRTGMVGDRCLVALDIDPRHNGDESLAKLLIEHGELPETPMCCTGGGGQHIFMWAPRSVPNSAGKPGDGRFGEGVDVRGEGGYVIAAPSKHESGRTYEWDSGAHPADIVLAEAPAWFVHLAGWSKKRHEATEGADVGTSERYIVGGRNDAMMRLAGAMRRVGAGLKRITDALLDENEERCHPPLDPAEVKKIARSAVKYPSGDPSPPGVDLFPLLSAAELDTDDDPVSWVVERLGIAPGAVTIVGGAGYGGKTVSMQALVLAVASGKPCWNQFSLKQGRAIHLDYEQGLKLTKQRYRRIARSMGFALGQLPTKDFAVSCLPRGHLDDKDAEDTMVRLCEGASVAIVDAFRGAFPTAVENDSSARKHLDMLQQASERTGCAMIVIAHSRKTGENTDIRTSLRGSGALYDAAQTVYMLDGSPRKPTKVHNTKDRLLGESRDMFGLTIADVIDARGEDRRWGLSVSYVHTAEVQAAYKVEDDCDGSSVMTNHDSLLMLVGRVIEFVKGYGEDGALEATIALSLGRSKAHISAALAEAVRMNGLRREGSGPTATYFAD